MIVQREFLTRIKNDFKLNIYEVKIWTALLSRGIATAGELADISGVPRSRCYDVLESLEKKGFIIMKIGKPIRYIAVKPEEIVSRVKKSLTDDSQKTINIFNSLKETDVFRELEMLYETGIEHVDPTDVSKSIVGKSAINHTIKDMLNKAKSNVVISTSQKSFPKDLGVIKTVLKSLNSRNIKMTIFAPINEKTARKYNVKKHNQKELDARFFIADDNLLFMLTDENANSDMATAVWVKSNFFTSGLSSLIGRL